MKISKQSLADAIEFPSSLIKTKTTHPILTTLKIEATNGKLTVTACSFDQHCSIVADCEGELAACCVPAHSIKTVLPLFADGVEMADEKGRLKIESGGTFTLGVHDAKDWPAWDSDKSKPLNVACADLAGAIRTVSFAVSQEEGRAALTNVHVFNDAKTFAVEATTGRELARVSRPAVDSQFKFLLPSAFIANACTALEMDGASVSISETKMTVKFSAGEYSCKLSEAIFPSTHAILNDDRTKIADIDPEKWQSVFSSCISLSGIDSTLACRFVIENDRIVHDGSGGKIDLPCPEKIKWKHPICSDSKAALACFKAVGKGKSILSGSQHGPIFLERDGLIVCFTQLRGK